MEARSNCGKKMNYKQIYSQIAKYGKTISEMAEEYEMTESDFLRRIQMGLDPKLYSSALKANKRNLKYRQTIKKNDATSIEINLEGKTMARKKETIIMQNYRQKQSERDKITALREKRQTLEDLKCQENVSEMTVLENKLTKISSEILKQEKELDETSDNLSVQEDDVIEKQKEFDKASGIFAEAKKHLEESVEKLDKVKDSVEQQSKFIENLKAQRQCVESQITELKNKKIYLVSPSYTGKKPEFGTFYSTTNVDGFKTLSITEVNTEFAIEPDLTDMLVAGYDSYKEYITGLRFVMLCAEYACKDIEYSVLIDDECLKKLLKKHVG